MKEYFILFTFYLYVIYFINIFFIFILYIYEALGYKSGRRILFLSSCYLKYRVNYMFQKKWGKWNSERLWTQYRHRRNFVCLPSFLIFNFRRLFIGYCCQTDVRNEVNSCWRWCRHIRSWNQDADKWLLEWSLQPFTIYERTYHIWRYIHLILPLSLCFFFEED